MNKRQQRRRLRPEEMAGAVPLDVKRKTVQHNVQCVSPGGPNPVTGAAFPFVLPPRPIDGAVTTQFAPGLSKLEYLAGMVAGVNFDEPVLNTVARQMEYGRQVQIMAERAVDIAQAILDEVAKRDEAAKAASVCTDCKQPADELTQEGLCRDCFLKLEEMAKEQPSTE